MDYALDHLPGTQTAELDEEFSQCLDQGGAAAAYAVTEKLDGHLLPLFYPIVVEHFLRARLDSVELTKAQRSRRARRLLKLAHSLAKAGDSARDLPNGPQWIQSMSGSLYVFARQLLELAQSDIKARNTTRPGSPMEISTSLARCLEALFADSDLSMRARCALIAGVITRFIEPMTGEKVRQRIKDLRRRPHRTSVTR